MIERDTAMVRELTCEGIEHFARLEAPGTSDTVSCTLVRLQILGVREVWNSEVTRGETTLLR